MKILSRYILKEYLGNLALGLAIFTFVLLLEHLFELVDLLLNKGAGLALTLQLLFLLLPSSLTLTLPMSALLAALLTFGRLSENNEITAARASGLPSSTFIKPPMGVALLATCFLIPFNTLWAPHAHADFRKLYLQVLERNPLIRIEEKIFLEVGDYQIYVDKKNKRSQKMSGVTIYKLPVDGWPLRIFAAQGTASVNAAGMRLDLQNGHIEQVDPAHPDQWLYTGFESYVLTIPVQGTTQTNSRSIEEMDNRELQSEIRRLKKESLPYPVFACQKYLRWALAVCPLLFVPLGVPLAIRVHRGGRAIGFALSLVVITGYYILLMGGTGLGQRGVWPPWLAVWLGNMVLASVAIFLNWRFLQR